MAFYSYIEKAYGMTFRPKDRVCHIPSGRCGEVIRPRTGYSHYVRVHFGTHGVRLCHPQELEVISQPPEGER